MKKLIALLLLSTLVSGEENLIQISCDLIKESHVDFSFTHKSVSFLNDTVLIDIEVDEQKLRLNKSKTEYIAITEGNEITITNKISIDSDNNFRQTDWSELLGFYEYGTVNRETGILKIKNYTKKKDDDEDFVHSFSRNYECRSVKIKF